MEHITAPRAFLALRTISDRILPTVGYRPSFGTVDIDGASERMTVRLIDRDDHQLYKVALDPARTG